MPPRPQLLTGAASPGLEAALVAMVERLGFTLAPSRARRPSEGRTGSPTRFPPGAGPGRHGRGGGREDAGARSGQCAPARQLAGQAAPAAKEVEAESVAYIVASVHGMDSGGYSFPYVSFGPARTGRTPFNRPRPAWPSGTADHHASPAAHDTGRPAGPAELATAALADKPGPTTGRSARRVPCRSNLAVNDRQPTGGPDLLLRLAAAALGLGIVPWSAAAASAWLSGHRPLHPGLLDGYWPFTHLGDPSLAWSAPV